MGLQELFLADNAPSLFINMDREQAELLRDHLNAALMYPTARTVLVILPGGEAAQGEMQEVFAKWQQGEEYFPKGDDLVIYQGPVWVMASAQEPPEVG